MPSPGARPALRRYLPVVAVGAGVVALVGMAAWFIAKGMSAPVPQAKKTIQQVQILRPPPPPPDQPPPPPPEVKEEVKVPEPEPEPQQAEDQGPPPGDLGLDAEGVAGGDAFGLLGRKGGRDLLAGESSDRFGWYGNLIKNELLGRLGEVASIRRARYSVSVRLWVAPDGRVERFRLESSTGNKDLDRDLTAALQALARVSEQPPEGMPQPVRLRIVSRG